MIFLGCNIGRRLGKDSHFKGGRKGICNDEFSLGKTQRQREAGACRQDPARSSRKLSDAEILCAELKRLGPPCWGQGLELRGNCLGLLECPGVGGVER